jgi:hypothetical protein
MLQSCSTILNQVMLMTNIFLLLISAFLLWSFPSIPTRIFCVKKTFDADTTQESAMNLNMSWSNGESDEGAESMHDDDEKKG